MDEQSRIDRNAYMRAYATDGRHGQCGVEGCERAAYGRTGLCEMHYQRKTRLGDVGSAKSTRSHPTMSPAERLRSRLSGMGDPVGCWHFDHGDTSGYGTIRAAPGQPMMKAHRLAYELWVGPIPEGLTIDHVCHNTDPTCLGGVCAHRRCCNPAHLEAVTLAENVRRGPRSQKERCKRGHDLTDPANLKPNSRGARQCRACSNLARMDRYVRLGR